MTFIDFLIQHYIKESASNLNDPDSEEDSKLPFKADENINSQITPYIVNSLKTNSISTPESIIFVNIKYTPVFSFSPQIWHPPRLI